MNFNTSKPLYKTAANKCHVNYVVRDSDWEAELAAVLESQPSVQLVGLSVVQQPRLRFGALEKLGNGDHQMFGVQGLS